MDQTIALDEYVEGLWAEVKQMEETAEFIRECNERIDRQNARYEWEQSHSMEFLYCVDSRRL